jgi:hypothetical protein
LFENLPQFDFGQFPQHPLETNTPMILNGPTSRNAVDLNRVSVEATSMYPPTRKLSIQVPAGKETECGGAP